MDRLSKGPEEGFADVMDFVRGLGSSTDALGDVLRRTEEEIDRLESIGVRASAPVREAVRGMVPEEVYGKYLEPAVEYAESEERGDRAGSSDGGVNHDGGEFDDDAVNAAADAVAAAMAGIDLGESSASASTSTSSSSATTKNGAPESFEESVENMAADAVMSSSTVSASYSAPEGMPYGADAPKVDSSATKTTESTESTESSSDARETKPEKSPEKSSSTAPFAATVGYWRKIAAECPDEEPLMDIMDMNIVFRQAAALLNYLRIEQPTSTTWSVASNAGVIQIAESYPIDGSSAVVSRRDLRSGDQIGSVSVTTVDPDAVRLESSWSAPLAGSQVETFRVDASGVLVRVVDISLENGESWSGTYRYTRA